jgi:uncharacterized delta-60 repeat protein
LRAVIGIAIALALPATAEARAGDPDGSFGRHGTVTLKATGADAVGGAVKALANGRVLAGGSTAGKLVVLRLRRTGSLDSSFGRNGQVAPALPGTSLDGVRALATFRDGRIVAAATLQTDGGTRMAVVRLLPNGEVDPSFGGGLGYALAGPAGSVLGSMAMDRTGDIVLAGARPAGAGEVPIVLRLAPDGTPDATFASFDGAALGFSGRATGVLARPDGTVVFCVGAGVDRSGPATFTVVRLLATGALDPGFAGTGIASFPLDPGSGPGAGAAALHAASAGTLLVAGTDVTAKGSLRGAVVRLHADGTLDQRFGRGGLVHIARAGRDLRITGLARDAQRRIVLVGLGAPPASLVVRLRANGARDRAFGNGGITFPRLGRPPGGDPVYTTLDAAATAGARVLLAGSAAGPGPLTRTPTGTAYGGRFALTVSRLK